VGNRHENSILAPRIADGRNDRRLGYWLVGRPQANRRNNGTQQKWEFKIEDCYDSATMLKNDGAQGSEVCGAYTVPASPSSPQVILKRRLP
jgi:hypothetical protein